MAELGHVADRRRRLDFDGEDCLGTPLARLEARVGTQELVRRVEEKYDVDELAARRVRHPSMRGFIALPTTVTAKRRAGRSSPQR
jgi:hypothetical protein